MGSDNRIFPPPYHSRLHPAADGLKRFPLMPLDPLRILINYAGRALVYGPAALHERPPVRQRG